MLLSTSYIEGTDLGWFMGFSDTALDYSEFTSTRIATWHRPEYVA